MSTVIGRKQEIEELERLYNSDRPEFVAVYGRRRVGKTFLIKQLLIINNIGGLYIHIMLAYLQ